MHGIKKEKQKCSCNKSWRDLKHIVSWWDLPHILHDNLLYLVDLLSCQWEFEPSPDHCMPGRMNHGGQ